MQSVQWIGLVVMGVSVCVALAASFVMIRSLRFGAFLAAGAASAGFFGGCLLKWPEAIMNAWVALPFLVAAAWLAFGRASRKTS